jgi:hypothetical protein
MVRLALNPVRGLKQRFQEALSVIMPSGSTGPKPRKGTET